MPEETVNVSEEEYFFNGVDFVDKLILDAGTGGGGTTERLVRKVIEAGNSSRIISVDHNQAALDNVRGELGDKAEIVQFLKADMTGMPQVESSSVDIIVCTDVLCMVEMCPLRSLKVLSELKRVLKPNGQLVMGEQIPASKATASRERVWARRWQIFKAMNHLLERRHLEEIAPEDLEFCLATLGFGSIRWAIFRGEDLGDSVEWGLNRPLATAKRLSDQLLQQAFAKQIDELRGVFAEHGGAFLPYYVMHARKRS